MSDATIIASIILGGVFLVMIVSILKSGIEGAIRMWNLMGALTGVAFGAITSFYFVNQVNQKEITGLQSAYVDAAETAAKAQESIAGIERLLKAQTNTGRSPASTRQKAALIQKLDTTNKELQRIQVFRAKLPEIKQLIPKS